MCRAIASRHPFLLFVNLSPRSPRARRGPEPEITGFSEPGSIRRAAHAPVGHQVKFKCLVVNKTRMPGIRMNFRVHPAAWKCLHDAAPCNIARPFGRAVGITGNEK